MLDEVESTAFTSLIGQAHCLRLPDGQALPIVLEGLTLSPRARMPQQQREPFSLHLTAPESGFIDGLCALEVPGMGLLEGVYVSRVAAAGRDPGAAYYQIIFG